MDARGEGAALPVPQQVTKGEFDEDGITWSPDGAEIFFASNREKEPYYLEPDRDLYALPAGGGEMRRVADIDGPIGEFA
ncbi:MAG: hypothetical protein DMF82_03765, partial [Acidobacteria bacterium]